MFSIVGGVLMFQQLDENGNANNSLFLRIHWFMQGFIIASTSLATTVFTACIRMAKDPNDEGTTLGWLIQAIVKQFGFLQTDFTRSIYIFVIGLYVYPLLPIYAEYATVSPVFITFSYFFALAAISASSSRLLRTSTAPRKLVFVLENSVSASVSMRA